MKKTKKDTEQRVLKADPHHPRGRPFGVTCDDCACALRRVEERVLKAAVRWFNYDTFTGHRDTALHRAVRAYLKAVKK